MDSTTSVFCFECAVERLTLLQTAKIGKGTKMSIDFQLFGYTVVNIATLEIAIVASDNSVTIQAGKCCYFPATRQEMMQKLTENVLTLSVHLMDAVAIAKVRLQADNRTFVAHDMGTVTAMVTGGNRFCEIQFAYRLKPAALRPSVEQTIATEALNAVSKIVKDVGVGAKPIKTRMKSASMQTNPRLKRRSLSVQTRGIRQKNSGIQTETVETKQIAQPEPEHSQQHETTMPALSDFDLVPLLNEFLQKYLPVDSSKKYPLISSLCNEIDAITVEKDVQHTVAPGRQRNQMHTAVKRLPKRQYKGHNIYAQWSEDRVRQASIAKSRTYQQRPYHLTQRGDIALGWMDDKVTRIHVRDESTDTYGYVTERVLAEKETQTDKDVLKHPEAVHHYSHRILLQEAATQTTTSSDRRRSSATVRRPRRLSMIPTSRDPLNDSVFALAKQPEVTEEKDATGISENRSTPQQARHRPTQQEGSSLPGLDARRPSMVSFPERRFQTSPTRRSNLHSAQSISTETIEEQVETVGSSSSTARTVSVETVVGSDERDSESSRTTVKHVAVDPPSLAAAAVSPPRSLGRELRASIAEVRRRSSVLGSSVTGSSSVARPTSKSPPLSPVSRYLQKLRSEREQTMATEQSQDRSRAQAAAARFSIATESVSSYAPSSSNEVSPAESRNI